MHFKILPIFHIIKYVKTVFIVIVNFFFFTVIMYCKLVMAWRTLVELDGSYLAVSF